MQHNMVLLCEWNATICFTVFCAVIFFNAALARLYHFAFERDHRLAPVLAKPLCY
jgi:hypothetical protein